MFPAYKFAELIDKIKIAKTESDFSNTNRTVAFDFDMDGKSYRGFITLVPRENSNETASQENNR